jgi:hypothetical protein
MLDRGVGYDVELKEDEGVRDIAMLIGVLKLSCRLVSGGDSSELMEN